MSAGTRLFLLRLRREVRRGFIPLWVMEQLVDHPTYGYELLERIAREYGSEFRVTPSTLYPTLSRLGPLRKYYELTPEGRGSLPTMRAIWSEVARLRGPHRESTRPGTGVDG
ncbi:MAG: PadR family transcriptional regulator [Thermoplasmata archaeon]|nr:PadR family transcriptional regulator [Thermoplasmata archaeon]